MSGRPPGTPGRRCARVEPLKNTAKTRLSSFDASSTASTITDPGGHSPGELRDSDHSGQGFRSNPDSHFGPKRTRISEDSGQGFRTIPDNLQEVETGLSVSTGA